MKKALLFVLLAVCMDASSIMAEDQLVTLEEKQWQYCAINYQTSVNYIYIREHPSIFAPECGLIKVVDGKEVCPICATGKNQGGWIEIKHRGVVGWIFGEFVGHSIAAEYQEFDLSKYYWTETERIVARCQPTILSACCGFCIYKDTLIKIVGQQGLWLKTDKGKWIYHELLKEAK